MRLRLCSWTPRFFRVRLFTCAYFQTGPLDRGGLTAYRKPPPPGRQLAFVELWSSATLALAGPCFSTTDVKRFIPTFCVTERRTRQVRTSASLARRRSCSLLYQRCVYLAWRRGGLCILLLVYPLDLGLIKVRLVRVNSLAVGLLIFIHFFPDLLLQSCLFFLDSL